MSGQTPQPSTWAEWIARIPDAQKYLALAAGLVAILAAIDGALGHFRTARKLGGWGMAVARYVRDFVLGPVKVRRLERSILRAPEPLYHLGMVWFVSEVTGRSVAHCQACWADGRRIALRVYERAPRKDTPMMIGICDYKRDHGTVVDAMESGVVVTKSDYEHAMEHVHDARRLS